MRHLIVLVVMAFLFAGCIQKQVVPLKMPQKQTTVQTTEEDKKTVIEEFAPNETIIKEEIIDNKGSKNEIIEDSEELLAAINEAVLNFDETKAKIKLAFVYPSSLVSKYAKNSINTVAGYLSSLNTNYNLEVIDSINESEDNILKVIDTIKEKEITKVIALYTPNAINILNRVNLDDMIVYLPLIEEKESLIKNDNLIFGSISYEKQLQKLSDYINGTSVLFYQDTYLGNKLRNSYEAVIGNTIARKEIRSSDTNFKNIVKDSRLNGSIIYLNTNIVKSSLILSQIRANEMEPKAIFSTQINFDPMLLVLTQDKDRERLVIASSIESIDSRLKDEILTYGGNINFEWVDYSTLVGVNYLINGNNSFIPTKIDENQAIYNPRLFKSADYGFVEIK